MSVDTKNSTSTTSFKTLTTAFVRLSLFVTVFSGIMIPTTQNGGFVVACWIPNPLLQYHRVGSKQQQQLRLLLQRSPKAIASTVSKNNKDTKCMKISGVHHFIPTRFYRGDQMKLLAMPDPELFLDKMHIATQLSSKTTTISSSLSNYLYATTIAEVGGIDIAGIVKNIGMIVGTLVLVLFGFGFLAVNVILPKACNELEKAVQESYPQLWAEYESKLQPGETLINRPDLARELAAKIQQLKVEPITENSFEKLNTIVPTPINTSNVVVEEVGNVKSDKKGD